MRPPRSIPRPAAGAGPRAVGWALIAAGLGPAPAWACGHCVDQALLRVTWAAPAVAVAVATLAGAQLVAAVWQALRGEGGAGLRGALTTAIVALALGVGALGSLAGATLGAALGVADQARRAPRAARAPLALGLALALVAAALLRPSAWSTDALAAIATYSTHAVAPEAWYAAELRERPDAPEALARAGRDRPERAAAVSRALLAPDAHARACAALVDRLAEGAPSLEDCAAP